MGLLRDSNVDGRELAIGFDHKLVAGLLPSPTRRAGQKPHGNPQ